MYDTKKTSVNKYSILYNQIMKFLGIYGFICAAFTSYDLDRRDSYSNLLKYSC